MEANSEDIAESALRGFSPVDPSIVLEDSADNNLVEMGDAEDNKDEKKEAEEKQEPAKETEAYTDVPTENVAEEDQDVATESSAKPSRELKSLLELSKEAKLDTNISHKRKSLDPHRGADQVGVTGKTEGGPSASKKERIMRSQNPEFLAKHHKFLSKIAAVDNDSINSSDSEDKAHAEVAKKSNANSPESLREQLPKKPRKNNKDEFCWRCHHNEVQISCRTCVRSFHIKCVNKHFSSTDNWPCPECEAVLRAENMKSRSTLKGMSLEQICGLLKFAHKRMIRSTDAEPFMHPVNEKDFPDYSNYIVYPMDLTTLQNNIRDNVYGSPTAFHADAKWILHNSIIFNSYQAKVTSMAKKVITMCRQEMQEIENCPSCYLNANTKKEWFIEVCPQPHLLVWAKLKGFPYWPAKAMSTNSSGMVDVRFFGAHDRAWVPIVDCFLYTPKDPNTHKQKRNDIMECIKELETHISKLEEIYGPVQYPPYKTLIDPKEFNKQISLFIPSFKCPEKSEGGDTSLDNIENESFEVNSSNDKSFASLTENNAKNSGYESDSYSSVHSENDENQSIEEDEYETQIPSSSQANTEDNLLNGKAKKTYKNLKKRKRNSSDQSGDTPIKLMRRNSNISTKSDSSRISEKINKVNISENVELALSNTDKQVSITCTSESDVETPKKPVQLNMENKEICISPQNKTSVVDYLMQKLNENNPLKESDVTVASIKKQIFNKMNNPGDKESENKEATDKESDLDKSLTDPLAVSDTTDDKNENEENIVEETSKPKEKPTQHTVKLINISDLMAKGSDKTLLSDKPEITIIKKDKKSASKEDTNKSSEQNELDDSQELVEIKIEVDEDQEFNDYVSKRDFFSSLNITEKDSSSKEPQKPTNFKITDNMSKIIDTVASTYSKENEGKEIQLKKVDSKTIKPFMNGPSPKIKPKKPIRPVPQMKKIEDKIPKVLTTTPVLQNKSIPANSLMLIAPTSMMNTLCLPQNRGLTTAPIITMISSSSLQNNEENTVSRSAPGLTLLPNIMCKNPASLKAVNGPSIATVPNPMSTVNLQNSSENVLSSSIKDSIEQLHRLADISPDNLSRAVSDILCRPPPTLKPRPPGMLSTNFQEGLPSSAGTVTAKINSISHRFTDYFRGMLIETLQELGTEENPQIAITNLKQEIEELKQKHKEEIVDIKNNITSILKDIQKSIQDDRQRIINDTRAACETETIQRIQDTKKRQWCANCLKEAYFFCCWNTSYCDYSCQKQHWSKHSSECQNNTNNTQPVSSTVKTSNQPVLQRHSLLKNTTPYLSKTTKLLCKTSTPNQNSAKNTNSNHLTIVESTPGKYELIGKGPLGMGGKIVATSNNLLNKIKQGKIISISSPK